MNITVKTSHIHQLFLPMDELSKKDFVLGFIHLPQFWQ
jgi:hypothetical protein